MAKRKKGKNNRSRRAPANSAQRRNFVAEAGPGCFIARFEDKANDSVLLAWEALDLEDYDVDPNDIPDIALDPEERTVTLCNATETLTKVGYVTIYLGDEACCYGKGGQLLRPGTTTDPDGQTHPCVTFIVLCPPLQFAHLCHIGGVEDLTTLRIESDVQEWNKHPSPNDMHSQPIGFPLLPDAGPYLCTQGVGGHLTHFFGGNLHAIDFRCETGTPLVAVADGIVKQVRCANDKVTGVAVSNLFSWNSVLIQLDESSKDGPLFVEYVHIQSSCVRVGDRVCRGQVIGTSGSVGFSPEPHLHFAAYRSEKEDAPTVAVRFDSGGKLFEPVAGQWFNSTGRVEKID